MTATRFQFWVFTAILSAFPATLKAEEPRLVVMITCDGLRGDLIQRYDAVFEHGLRRLLDDGMRFDSATVDHAITVSHAGHVTLATGRHPAHHGVVDAAYYVPTGDTRLLVDAVEDSTENIVGVPDAEGASPRQIEAPGIGQWIATHSSGSRTFAVGSGRFSSLLHSYARDSQVYWFLPSAGRYVTSTYYANADPEWITEFNAGFVAEQMDAAVNWECSVPQAHRPLARPDSARYEGDQEHTTFPHRMKYEMSEPRHAQWLAWTPFLDETTLELAGRGVEEMSLGQGGSIDYLSIVLSQTDDTAHYYGPRSLEHLDVLVRLDRWLGRFLDRLDATVGEGKYVLALSSDHGFVDVLEYRTELGLPAYRITAEEIDSLMALADSVAAVNPATSSQAVAELAQSWNIVAEAMVVSQLLSSEDNDDFHRLFRNSCRPDRIPRLPIFSLTSLESALGRAGVMVRLTEGTMIDLNAANHGSAYPYDRNVPIVFYGTGVKSGHSAGKARTIDVAPTLSALAGIPIPDGVDGTPLIQ